MTYTLQPGDGIAFRTRGVFAVLIQTGQRIGALGYSGALKSLFRGLPADAQWTRYTHWAIVESVVPESTDAVLLQAVRRIGRCTLSSYGETPYIVVPFPGGADRRAAVLRFAQRYVGFKYGVLSVISRGLNYVTPDWLRVDFSRAGRMDCSGYGARAWEHGGVDLPVTVNPFSVTPGQLVLWFG